MLTQSLWLRQVCATTCRRSGAWQDASEWYLRMAIGQSSGRWTASTDTAAPRRSRRRQRDVHTMAGRASPSASTSASAQLAMQQGDDVAAILSGSSEKRASSTTQHPAPPQSLQEYMERKGQLAVTNITKAMWCEYALQYQVLGMSHLPVADRPAHITTPQGNVITPDQKRVLKQEKILKAGKVTHKRLERETQPVEIHVRTQTNEDQWALTLLGLASGIKRLINEGKTRELPVFGFIDGQFVRGIIDEISRKPLPRHVLRFLDARRKESKPGEKIGFYFGGEASSQAKSNDLETDGRSSPKTKRWTSQEEWKRDKLRSSRTESSPSSKSQTSPRKSMRRAPPEAGQARIAAFFSTNASQDKREAIEDVEKSSIPERYGYYIEDSKTRKRGFVPDKHDQAPDRLQVMLYRRLLDGLLVGCGSRHEARPERLHEARLLTLDAHAEGTTALDVMMERGLDTAAPLSSAFMEDAARLLEGQDGFFLPSDDSGYTLTHIAGILQETLVEFTASARRGLGWTEPVDGITGAVQQQLYLTYRRQRKTDRAMPDAEKTGDCTTGVDPQIANASGASVDLHDDKTSSQGASPTTPNNAQDDSSSDADGKSASTSPSLDTSPKEPIDKDIIARVQFSYDARMLSGTLHDILAMWRGQRPLKGVSLQDSWRCWPCAFRNDCEWREKKGREKLDDAALARMNKYRKRHGQGQPSPQAATAASATALAVAIADGAENNEEQDALDKHEAIGDAIESQASVNTIPDDDDEALWSQFEDFPTDLAW